MSHSLGRGEEVGSRGGEGVGSIYFCRAVWTCPVHFQAKMTGPCSNWLDLNGNSGQAFLPYEAAGKKKNVEVEIRAGLRIAQGAVPAKWGRKMCFQVLLATVRLAQPGEASCSSWIWPAINIVQPSERMKSCDFCLRSGFVFWLSHTWSKLLQGEQQVGLNAPYLHPGHGHHLDHARKKVKHYYFALSSPWVSSTQGTHLCRAIHLEGGSAEVGALLRSHGKSSGSVPTARHIPTHNLRDIPASSGSFSTPTCQLQVQASFWCGSTELIPS